jgi:P-type E1-E2 ATPase
LSEAEAEEARSLVGENAVHLTEPTLARCVVREFSKPFYVYQTFMMWSWFNFYFWHMALIQTCVRVVGGLTVALVTYRNEANLFRLGNVSGHVKVLRQGTLVTIPQKDLVPGDVMEVLPGTLHCDVALLHGNLLVDESALTGEAHPVAKSALDPAEG